jgi:hypothetical protein
MTPLEHLRVAVAEITGLPAESREVGSIAFALAKLAKPLLLVITHGYGHGAVVIERGRFLRWRTELVGPAEAALEPRG